MTSCTCTHPPGGGGKCSEEQIAICRSNAGQCHMMCLDLTRDLKQKLNTKSLTVEYMGELVTSLFGMVYLPLEESTLISLDGRSTVRYTLPKNREGDTQLQFESHG